MRRRTAAVLAIALAVALVALPMTAHATPRVPSGPSADRFVGGKAPVTAAKTATPRAVAPAATKANLSDKSSIIVALNMTVSDKIEYTLGTDVWLDGILVNPFVQSLQDVQVTIEYFDAGSVSLG